MSRRIPWPEAFLGIAVPAWGLWAEASRARWDAWPRAACWPADCFCEALRAAGVVQPANTWSNLAFLLAGLWISHDALGRPGAAWGPGRVLGLSACLIGATSFFYHATMTYLGMWLDLMGMYLFVTFFWLANAGLGRRLVPVLLALNGALGALIWALPGTRRWLFAGLVVLAVRSECSSARGGAGWLWGALGLLAAGFASWSVDYSRVVCAPQSSLQGHAAWHLLCAAGVLSAYRHLRGRRA